MSLRRAQHYGRAAEIVESIIRDIYGVNVCKAENLATTEGMEAEARRVGRVLLDATMPLESTILKRGRESLGSYSPGQSETSLKALASSLLGDAKKNIPKISEALSKETAPLFAQSRKDASKQYGLRDQEHPMTQKATGFLSRVDPLFIEAAYDSKAESLAKRWSDVIATKGSIDSIRSALVGTLDTGLNWGSPESYWSIVGMAYVNRIKSWSTSMLFSSNKVKTYKWVSVLDGATSMQCRFLDGKTFPVAQVMEKLAGLLDAKDLATVRKLQPFLQIGKQNEGRVIYYDQEGETKIVASIQGGDASPRFFSHLGESSELALIEAGVVFPPIHTWCRSTIVPEI